MIVLWVWAAWQTARRTAGEGFGMWAGLYVAVPPVFLSFVQLSSSGEAVAVTCGAIVVTATGRLLDPELPPRNRAFAWTVLGLAAGVGWWASQIMGMFLVTAVLSLLVAQPRAWRSGGPYVASGLFALTSLPLWVWNLQHDWATFRHLATWGDGLAPLGHGVRAVAGALVATLRVCPGGGAGGGAAGDLGAAGLGGVEHRQETQFSGL